MKTPSFLCLLVTPLLTLSLASTLHAADKDLSKMDKSFVQKAAIGGMFEVEAGKVASEMGASQGVKDFGAKMVEDHGKANDELKGIVTSKGMDVPSALDSAHQKKLDELKSKSGKDFDSFYVSEMKKDHKEDNALFMKEAKSGKDADIKAFASKTDETVKMHIQMLKDMKM